MVDQLLPLRRPGVPRDHGEPRRAPPRRAHRPHRVPEHPAGRDAEAAQARPDADAVDRRARVRQAAVLPRAAQRAVRQGRARRADGRATCWPRSRRKSGGSFAYEVSNHHRSIGARALGRDRAALGQQRHERRAAHGAR